MLLVWGAVFVAVGLFLVGGAALAAPPDATLTLAWDYPQAREGEIDRFVLQRADVDNDWADLPLLILPSMRLVIDDTVLRGVRYRYRVLAERSTPPPLLRSVPSNEVVGRAKPGKSSQ
jgi:hypothetical protein